MTRSKMKSEMDERTRAMTAEDHALEYLYKHHRDHAAEIAMRVLYRLALMWKVEQEDRFIRKDLREVFEISHEYVRRVYNKIAELPPPSRSDAMAGDHVMTLLAEFEPDRAWLISHKVYRDLAWPTGHTFHLFSRVSAAVQTPAPLVSRGKPS